MYDLSTTMLSMSSMNTMDNIYIMASITIAQMLNYNHLCHEMNLI